MSPTLQRYLRSISASHPNSGAASQARPPVPAPHRHPAPIPPAATIIGKSLSATLIGTPFSHYHWHTTISHDHWHSIPGTPGYHARQQHIFIILLPNRHYWQQRHRPTSSRFIMHGITEDHREWHHQTARRHHRRLSSRTSASPSRTTTSQKTVTNGKHEEHQAEGPVAAWV